MEQEGPYSLKMNSLPNPTRPKQEKARAYLNFMPNLTTKLIPNRQYSPINKLEMEFPTT
jgi:hypothetical protein